MNKVTVKNLLAIDDKKDVLNMLIDAGIMDARDCICILIDKDDQSKIVSNKNDLEVFGILNIITERIKIKITGGT